MQEWGNRAVATTDIERRIREYENRRRAETKQAATGESPRDVFGGVSPTKNAGPIITTEEGEHRLRLARAAQRDGERTAFDRNERFLPGDGYENALERGIRYQSMADWQADIARDKMFAESDRSVREDRPQGFRTTDVGNRDGRER